MDLERAMILKRFDRAVAETDCERWILDFTAVVREYIRQIIEQIGNK